MSLSFIAYFILFYTLLAIILCVYYFLFLMSWLRNRRSYNRFEPDEKPVVKKAADPHQKTMLMGIVQTCDSPDVVLNALQEGANVNETHEEGMTPLMEAAKSNQNVHILFTLLSAGAKVDAVDSKGRSALAWAAGNNSSPMVISALIEAGANVNHVDVNQKTALMYAAQFNPNPAVVGTLLKAGADKTLRSNSGKTAYDYIHENKELYKTPVFDQLKV